MNKLKPDLVTLLYAVLFCVAQHYGIPIGHALATGARALGIG